MIALMQWQLCLLLLQFHGVGHLHQVVCFLIHAVAVS